MALAHELGGFSIGVAAFPEAHPSAASKDADARVLVAKAEAGAEFAVTQLFFRASDYADLVDRVRALGCDIPILPGIMPITNLRQVTRMAELSGADLPDEVLSRGSTASPSRPTYAAWASQIATELCQQVLELGAPGLHFYTLNRSRATLEIFEALRITVTSSLAACAPSPSPAKAPPARSPTPSSSASQRATAPRAWPRPWPVPTPPPTRSSRPPASTPRLHRSPPPT